MSAKRRPLPTEAQIARTIRAMQKCGVVVAEVRMSDGEVRIIPSGPQNHATVDQPKGPKPWS